MIRKVEPTQNIITEETSDRNIRDMGRTFNVLFGFFSRLTVCLGLFPGTANQDNSGLEFKLFSWKSLYSLIALLVTNLPFTALCQMVGICLKNRGQENFVQIFASYLNLSKELALC